MIVSDNRLIRVIPPWQQRYSWPVSEPDDDLDYSFDVTAALLDANDQFEYATACVAPHGLTELYLSSMTYADGIITLRASYGVPGRVYIINIKVYCSNGRQFSFFVELPISANSVVNLPGPPYSPYYSNPIST
jgi:hypothetical protein